MQPQNQDNSQRDATANSTLKKETQLAQRRLPCVSGSAPRSGWQAAPEAASSMIPLLIPRQLHEMSALAEEFRMPALQGFVAQTDSCLLKQKQMIWFFPR